MTTGANALRNPTSCPAEDAFEAVDAKSVYRRVTVKPAMSGHNSLFVGQIGDWTWDTVTALCGTNVFTATNASGAPTYLAFYYFHLRGSPVLHSAGLTFGDRLEVVSTAPRRTALQTAAARPARSAETANTARTA